MVEPSRMSDVAKQQWDVIVIGTGVGGSTLGYALAKAGKNVLFCEKGKSNLNSVSALRGAYAETFFLQPAVPQPEHREILLQAGRYCDTIEDHSHGQSHTFIPFIGSGTGGSSALYGMAMERFFPSDFHPRHNYPDAKETTLPEEWPISYANLAPYYEAAEQLYRIHGTGDPLRGDEPADYLRPPPPLTRLGSELFHFFQRKGLHPYRLPMACEFVPGCECCQGYLCAKNCKNDAASVCLAPAIRHYGAHLLDECEVLKLDATRNEVTGVVCAWRGDVVTLRGKVIILAAGALESPRILLRSVSDRWPIGLANDTGLVGKNLMRHHIDLYIITPQSRGASDNRQKEFAFNDFYQADGKKLGSVQSFGRLPPAAVVVESIVNDMRQSANPWKASLFKLAKPAIKQFLRRLVNRSVVLATTLEDIPYAGNAVLPIPVGSNISEGRLAINYSIHPGDKERIELFRDLMSNVLKPYRYTLVKQAESNERMAHACGTCRFGKDPRSSVLDMYNRAHSLSNLYVVDSSFFPSSGGTNPSLTIAANALRVATHIIDSLS